MCTKTSNVYLKQVDSHKDNTVISAFLTAGNDKFLLLHNNVADDTVKHFFNDVYEYYVKIIMNPFYEPNTKI